jgi:hypothetical protein
MINRYSDSAGPPTPHATRVGQGRFAPTQTADPLRCQNGNNTTQPATPKRGQPPETAKPGGNQSARIAAQHAQISVSDPAAQPKSP